MSSRSPRVVVLLAAAMLLAACDRYDAAGVPGPRPAPAPAPSAGLGSSGTSAGSASPEAGTPVDACPPIAAPTPAAVVEALRAADGGCVPPADAVMYRCDPSLDPVAALELGNTTRRFLGGRFATPVAQVPAGAVPIGVAAAGRLWTVPGDDSSLFLEGSAGVDRWLAMPRRKDVTTPPSALIIGDSVIDGAREQIVAALPGWTITIDAEVGRGSYGAAAMAEAVLAPVPEVVVVEVGVNDHDPVGFAANLQRVVAAAEAPLLLLWLTAHGPDADTDDINRAIVAGIGALPRGAVADWDTIVPPDALDPDGVHLLPDRQGVLADLVAGRLRAWRQAAVGEGATGCEGPIRAAARHASQG